MEKRMSNVLILGIDGFRGGKTSWRYLAATEYMTRYSVRFGAGFGRGVSVISSHRKHKFGSVVYSCRRLAFLIRDWLPGVGVYLDKSLSRSVDLE